MQWQVPTMHCANHVTQYMFRDEPGDIEFGDYVQGCDDSDLRITVDEPLDFDMVSRLFDQHNAADLGAADIVKILRSHPELAQMNSHIEQIKPQVSERSHAD